MFMRVLVSCSLALFVGQGLSQQVAAKLPRRDAAVEAIMVPNDDPRYASMNPAVHQPRVVIRNAGSDPLGAISIRYGTDGFLPRMFAWNGHLATGATAEVMLPHLIDMRPGVNSFTVVLGGPNGRKDKNKANNTLSCTFTAADALTSPLTVRWRVPAGVGGSLSLESTRGPVVLDRKWKAGPDTVFREIVEMPEGSYFVQVLDSSRTAHSSVRITTGEGDLIKVFSGKQKPGAAYQFRVEAKPEPHHGPGSDAQLITLPGRGKALVDVYTEGKALVSVTNGRGETIVEWPVRERTDTTQLIDLSAHPAGTYSVKLRENGKETVIGGIDLLDGGPR